MSRGGANPNWEWQLVSYIGHHSDLGLRQRALVKGLLPANRALERERKAKAKAAKKPSVSKPNIDLFKLFGGNSK